MLSLQVMTVDRRDPAPTCRASVCPGTKQARFRAGSAERGAGPIGPASFVRRPATTLPPPRAARPAARSRRCSPRPRQRFSRSQERSPQRTARPAQADLLSMRQESKLEKPGQNGCASVCGKSQGARDQGILAAHKLDGFRHEPESQNPADSTSRERCPIRTGVRQLGRLPLRYFPAVLAARVFEFRF